MQKLYSQPIKREEKKGSAGHKAPLNKPLFLPLVKPINGPMRSPGKKKEEETTKKTELAPDAYQSGLKAEDNLQSVWFKNINELEDAYDGKFAFGMGAQGLHVQRIQLALLDLQQTMRWTDEHSKQFTVNLGPGGDDGQFGPMTETSLTGVQKKLNLEEKDGKVGRETMRALDKLFKHKKEPPKSYNEEKHQAKQQAEIIKTDYFSKGRIGATTQTIHDIRGEGKKIYDRPAGQEKFRLTYGTSVDIYYYNSDGWYYINADGKMGWVQTDYVKDPMPLDDEQAQLHFVEPGQTLSQIVQSHYAGISEHLNDARLLTYAVALANAGRTGISINLPKGAETLSWFDKVALSDRGEKAQAIWRSVSVAAGANIWLPSVIKLYELLREGKITSGSRSDELLEDLQVGIAFGFGLIEGVVQSLADLFIGLYELGVMVVKVIGVLISPQKMMELFEMLKEIDFGEVWEAIKKSGSKILEEFSGSWNNPDRVKAAEFRGKVIGYVIAEILLAIFSGGILTEIKWISTALAKMGKAGEFLMELINTVRKGMGKVARVFKGVFSDFSNLDELAILFKGKNLLNSVDDLIKSGWKKVDGNWGTKTVFEKQVGKDKYYAIWESANMEHSTNKLPTSYWKLTKGKISAYGNNVRRVSNASNFKAK